MDANVDPIVLYSRSLYDYTFNLWTESQLAGEKTREQPLAIPPSAIGQQMELESTKSS